MKTKWREESAKQRAKCEENFSKRNYIIEYESEGHIAFTAGDTETQLEPTKQRCLVSLYELQEFLNTSGLGVPFWKHPDAKKDATEQEQDAIPFNEKKWGMITNLKITPLPTNKEEN